MRRQLGGHEDRGWAVSTANDGDGGSLLEGELHTGNTKRSQRQGAEQRTENTELRSSTQQQRFGVGQHRPEIGHSADTQKNQQREDTGRQAYLVDQVQKARPLCHVGHRNVRQQATKTNGQQQQRLEALFDGQVDQQQAHRDHERLAGLQMVQTGALPELEQLFHDAPLSRWSAGLRPLPLHRRP